MMKRISIAVLAFVVIACLLPVTAAICADEPEYEVSIKVKYNAESPAKAAKIVAKAQKDHTTACKTEITSKLIDGKEYEVVIDVVYNSLPVAKAMQKIEQAQREHADACTVDIHIKKPETDTWTITDASIIWSGSVGGVEVCCDENGDCAACE